jgi:dihydrolipoamide dehydrogenase
VVEYLDRIAPGADEAVSSALQRFLEKQGLKFRLTTEVLDARVGGDCVSVTVQSRTGGAPSTIEADVVLVATGRRPFTGALGLERIGLKLDPHGFITTRTFQTDVPGVWAIGDVIGGAMLAHKPKMRASRASRFWRDRRARSTTTLFPASSTRVPRLPGSDKRKTK